MRPATFYFTLNLIRNKLLREKLGCPMISPEKQFFIAIWRMATPDSYRSICEKFNVARATALKSVRRVMKALAELAQVFITWPNEARAAEISNGFSNVSGFPNTIGAIDGTHISIPAPKQNPECYINRKGHHSIQMQAVSDHQCRFIHCYIGNVGSVHDQRVFRLSEISNYLNDPLKFPRNCHLIGDSAYMLNKHLLTPYRDNGRLTNRQRNYNYCLASARMAIERTFGLLKGRFRSLLTVLDMERIDLIPEFVLACCVLHNICLMKGEEIEAANVDNILAPLEEGVHVGRAAEARNIIAEAKRNDLCQALEIRNV